MTRVTNKPKISSKGIISYLFGAFFLLMSLGSFVLHGYIAGLLFFFAAIFTIPPAVDQLEKKINGSMPGISQFFIVFLLVAMAFAASPDTPAAQNSTGTIAAPPSSVNGSETKSVPAEQTSVTISNSTSNPNNSSPATPAPKVVSTPTPTSTHTQTLDNKGKFDILTNPAGATITVDGVSEGVSPIEGLSVNSGTHSVTVYLSGYDLQQEKVEVANSETKELFYTLVPKTKQSSTSAYTLEETSTPEVTSTPKETSTPEVTSTPKETSTPEVTSTSTPKASNYQDAQWLLVFSSNSNIVANDLKYISDAATKTDYASLSIYAKSLFADSKKAIDDSDMYSVSPDLQGIKDEYRLAMVQANWAALFINDGIEEMNKGDIQAATSDINQATQNMESCLQHVNNVNTMLKSYNPKKS